MEARLQAQLAATEEAIRADLRRQLFHQRRALLRRLDAQRAAAPANPNPSSLPAVEAPPPDWVGAAGGHTPAGLQHTLQQTLQWEVTAGGGTQTAPRAKALGGVGDMAATESTALIRAGEGVVADLPTPAGGAGPPPALGVSPTLTLDLDLGHKCSATSASDATDTAGEDHEEQESGLRAESGLDPSQEHAGGRKRKSAASESPAKEGKRHQAHNSR